MRLRKNARRVRAVKRHASLLVPFAHKSYRRLWPADVLVSWATEMETLILAWYVLVETGSVVMLTLFGAVQFVGTLAAPLLGVVGDRIGHRNLMCGIRAFFTVVSLSLLALAAMGLLTPIAAIVAAFLSGLVRTSDLAARGALVARIVPPDQLTNAMGLSRTTSDSARVVGALTGASLFAAFGIAPAYALVVAFHFTGLLLTLSVPEPGQRNAADAAQPGGPPRSSPWADLREGLVFVWRTPALLAGMCIACLVNFNAFPLSNGLLPYVAKEHYGLDQTGLGWLVAGFAGGALIGSIVLSLLARAIWPGRVMIQATVVWYLLLLVFAQTTSPIAGFAVLMITGFVQSFSMISLSIMLLRIAGERFHGRVLGVRMLAIYSLPFGLMVAGWLIGRLGFQGMASLYAVSGLLATLAIGWRWRAVLLRPDGAGNTP